MKLLQVAGCCGFLLTLGLSSTPVVAQEDDKVIFMQAGADRLLEDLEFLLSLTDQQERLQWDNIRENIDIFLEGVDPARPVRIDGIFGDRVYYRSAFPITRLTGRPSFLNNLAAFGIDSKRRGSNYYTLSGAFEGFLRGKHDYGIISERQEDLPAGVTDPAAPLAPYLEKGYDAALLYSGGPEGVEDRRKSFAASGEEILAGITKRETEEDDEFEFRKLTERLLLKEVERFYAESREMTAGWIADVAAKEGRIEMYLEPLEETSLRADLDAIATTPSRFVLGDRPDDAIYHGTLTLPLDDFRKGHLRQLLEKSKTLATSRIDRDEKLPADGKTVAQQAIEKLYAQLSAGVDAGLFDGFMSAGGGEGDGPHPVVAGIRAPDGNAIVEILELLPKIRGDYQVEIGVEDVADVKLHRVTVAEARRAELKEFFSSDGVVYIGTSADSVWLASGPGALDQLKTLIEQSQTRPEDASPVFASLYVRTGPWLRLRQLRRGDEGGDPELRKKALDAFAPGDDAINFELTKHEDHIAGNGTFQTGILRFMGKVVAQFSKENLQ